MINISFLHTKRLYAFVILVPILILSLIGFICFSYMDIEEHTKDLNNICLIRRMIYHTHENIKMGALAPTQEEKNKFLENRYYNRKIADANYEILLSKKHSKIFDSELYSLYNFRNKEYRQQQDKVIFMIEHNMSDRDIWMDMSKYSTMMNDYLKRLDNLSKIIIDKINYEYKFLLKIVIAFILIVVLMGNFLVSHIYYYHNNNE